MPHRSSITSSPPSWTIQPVPSQAVDEVVTFINHARSGMFPGRSLTPDDASLFSDSTCFLEARDEKQLIAVIGYIPYNHRFPQFHYDDIQTVEVVRLFVQPWYRRCGLAAALFVELCDRAVAEGVECLYLHTHPFLMGAISFWETRGFEVIQVEDEPIWQTTHMQMLLKSARPA
jgi:GNAT superfamily N-acetyltransferase